MYPRIPLGTCRESHGIGGAQFGNHWFRVFCNTAPVVWYIVAVGTALTPQNTRLFDYNACPVFYALLVLELLKNTAVRANHSALPDESFGARYAFKVRAPCIPAYVRMSHSQREREREREREKWAHNSVGRGKKYLDAEVPFTSLTRTNPSCCPLCGNHRDLIVPFYAMKACRGNGGIAPLILNLVTRWMWLFIFSSSPVISGVRFHLTHWMLGWS